MSREPRPDLPPDPRDGPERPTPERRLTTTPWSMLVGLALTGLVLGWLVRPAATALDAVAPRVSWTQPVTLYLVALILGLVAWSTRAALRPPPPGTLPRRPLLPHQAVNRLVLAKSCALAFALVGGFYLGYALTWVGLESELAGERAWRSLVAAGGAVASVTCSLLLERACRTGESDPST